MLVCSVISDIVSDHLIKAEASIFLHCELEFFSLQLLKNSLTPYKYPISHQIYLLVLAEKIGILHSQMVEESIGE